MCERFIASLLVFLLLNSFSCVSPEVRYQQQLEWEKRQAEYQAALQAETLIISNPPGAKLEVGNEYIGNAPRRIRMSELCNSSEKRYSYEVGQSGMPIAVFTITLWALPTWGGHCTQMKELKCSLPYPKKVLFEMGLCSNAPAVIMLP